MLVCLAPVSEIQLLLLETPDASYTKCLQLPLRLELTDDVLWRKVEVDFGRGEAAVAEETLEGGKRDVFWTAVTEKV